MKHFLTDWSHIVIGNIQYTDHLKHDLSNWFHLHMVPRYHKYFNINLLQYCHNTHPFTMEERKVYIVQRHTGYLFQKIFHLTPKTLRIQVICITITILYWSKCIRIQADTTVLPSQSLEDSTFSHPCASLENIRIVWTFSETHQKTSHLETFVQKESQSQRTNAPQKLHRSHQVTFYKHQYCTGSLI